MHIREVAALVLNTKGLDALHRALTDARVQRVRAVLSQVKREGAIRLVGFQRARSALWALLEG
jgi:hypothetical protein